MEYWDIYDIDRIKKDGKVKRGEPLGEGECHLGIHVCVFNDKGQMLIQKRQPFKEGYAGRWDVSVGGSALVGENSRDAARRELLEEIGIECDFEDMRAHFTINRNHIFDDFYIVEKNVDVDTLTLQTEEVEAVRWATEDEIVALIEKRDFVPYYPELIRLIFAMRGRYGSYKVEK